MRVKLRESYTKTSHLLQVDSIAKEIIQEVMVGARPKLSVIFIRLHRLIILCNICDRARKRCSKLQTANTTTG